MRVGRGGHSEAFKGTVVGAIQRGTLTLRAIAETYGLSTATVCKWKREAGLPSRHGLTPRCHPDRPVYGRGLCRSCYYAAWWKERAA